MSGEDDRDPARPENTYLDDADIPLPALRPRRAKPPPNIITAGGVDMARGHASGIVIREGKGPEPAVDLPRVVIGVETDLRRIPTHRRLPAAAEAREKDAHPTPVATGAARAEGVAEAPSGQAAAPTPPPETKRLPIGLRVSFAALLILLLVGVVRRANAPAPPPAVTVEAVRPVLSVPPPVSALPEAPLAAASSSARPEPHVEKTDPDDLPSPVPVATSSPRPARPRATTTATHTAFTPPFELPAEKH